MSKRRRKKTKHLRPTPPGSNGPRLGQWSWWILAAALPIVLCALQLNRDLWYDEAYTIIAFVAKPWLEIATDYSAPNNHILYSLLLRPVCLFSAEDLVLRLPSLLFAAGTLALVFRLVRRWAGTASAALSTLALGLTPMFLVHAMQVRGYGLSMLLAAWLSELALPCAQPRQRLRCAAIVLLGAAFVYTIPTNAFFLAAIAVGAVGRALLVERRLAAIGREIAVWMAAAGLAIVLYLPVWHQLRGAAFDRSVASFAAVFDLVRSTYFAALRDWMPVLVPAVLGAGFFLRDAAARMSAERVAFALLIAAALSLPFVLTGLLGVVPFPRNFCPMLPLLAAALGCTVARAVEGVGQLAATAWPPAATVAIAAALLIVVALPQVLTYPARLVEARREQPRIQDGYFNYYVAEFEPSRVVSYLQSAVGPQSPYAILMADEDYYCLAYYCWRLGMPLTNMEGGRWTQPVAVYIIAPEKPDYRAISARSGLPVEVLRRFALVERFGYYHLFGANASPHWLPNAIPSGQVEPKENL